MATTTSTKLPRVILGTMTFGPQVSQADAATQLQTFVDTHTGEDRDTFEIDTARMYDHGETEHILGRIFEGDAALRAKLSIATKVNPFKGYNETLSPESVWSQAAECLGALKADSVDILYLHAPDLDTPIERTLEAINELYVAGKFRVFGLSNYPAWGVAHIYHLCERHGYPKPAIYQGMYNAITRDVERELLPCLHTLGIRFVCYNPLAGGMLTGKHASMEADATGSRFDASNTMYRDRFWRESVFKALDVIRAACDEARWGTWLAVRTTRACCDTLFAVCVGSIPMADAALRWVMHHSKLDAGKDDGVIIGASSQAHLVANIAAVNAGPLPEPIVNAYDDAWELARADCPKYFRP